MEIERFKSKLSKDQLEAMAIDTVRQQLDNVDEYTIYRFSKKLLFFAEKLKGEAEDKLKDVWADKDQPEDMNYTTGGAILNYREDPTYEELERALKERRELLNTAQRQTGPMYDADGAEIPKVSIKDYRKDSINVKI